MKSTTLLAALAAIVITAGCTKSETPEPVPAETAVTEAAAVEAPVAAPEAAAVEVPAVEVEEIPAEAETPPVHDVKDGADHTGHNH